MDTTLNEYILTCPHCGKRLNSWFKDNTRGVYLNKKLNKLSARYFCTEECYKNYMESFVVETYNGEHIFCVEINGEKRYMPYFEAHYYFTSIDDCKKRMDMKNVAVWFKEV